MLIPLGINNQNYEYKIIKQNDNLSFLRERKFKFLALILLLRLTTSLNSLATSETQTNDLAVNFEMIDDEKTLELIEKHLESDGSLVYLYGENYNMEKLKSSLFKKLQIPFISDDSNLDHKRESKNLLSNIALYNLDGMIISKFDHLEFPYDTPDEIINDFISESIELKESRIKESREYFINNTLKSTPVSLNQTLNKQTHVTASTEIYDNFNVLGQTISIAVGKHITDYHITIKKNDGASERDYAIVNAESQVESGHNLDGNVWVDLLQYKSGLKRNRSSDKLLSWSPDTTNVNYNNGSTVTVSIGFPWNINLSYTWVGNAMRMITNGSKSTHNFEVTYSQRFGKLSDSDFTHNFTTVWDVKHVPAGLGLVRLDAVNSFGVKQNTGGHSMKWYPHNYLVNWYYNP